MLLALTSWAAPALARDADVPELMSVTVVPPSGMNGPTPTGDVVVSLDGDELLSVSLGSPASGVSRVTPLIAGAVSLLGRRITVNYSGDSNYEASDGVTVAFPARNGVRIVAKPRDGAAPVIEVVAPREGAAYARGERVVARYSCSDPEDRSTVTRCEGPVAEGSEIDTSSPGSREFLVRSADSVGNEASRTITYEVTDGDPPPPPAAGEGAPPPPPASPPPAPAPATPGAGDPQVATALIPAGLSAGARPGSQQRGQASAGTARGDPPSASSAGASDVVAGNGAVQAFAPYDPRSEPVKSVGILVAGFTLLQLAMSGGGLALARGGGGVGSSGEQSQQRSADGAEEKQSSAPEASFDYESVDVAFLGAGVAAVAVGDRSRTWGWPGTRRLDALGAALPARVAHRSPLLARVLADGTYLRAIFGSASLLAVLAGVALGVLAVHDTGGAALPPVAALTIAIAVLGVLDATAGFVAILTFTIGVLALGGIDSNAQLRLMLGLGALWFVVPVLAGAVRPLRREPTRNLVESWERAADFVIASLIGAWAVQKIVLALPGLAGAQLPISAHADLAALCVLAALVGRLVFETIAAHLYPRRLDVSEAGQLPEPGALQRLGSTALRMGIFVFFARIVVGDSWQLWAAAALFVAPQILAVYAERFPNSPTLYRALPKGLVELVFMLFVGTAVGALLISSMDENADTFLANSLVLLSLPGFLLSLLQLFARDGPEPAIGWGKRIAGVALLGAGILLALGLLL